MIKFNKDNIAIAPESTLNEMLRTTLCNIRPDYIIEVGCYDGETLRHYKDSCPYSAVIGFEASPTNYFKYCIGKGVQMLAVSNYTGSVKVYEPVVRARKAANLQFKKERVCSLKKVVDGESFKEYNVLSTTLDDFFKYEIEAGKTFALIIDAEGTTYEILLGAEKLLENTIAIKAEVEDVDCWHGQYTTKHVHQLLIDRFGLVGHTNMADDQKQHNRYYFNRNNIDTVAYFRSVGEEY